MAIVTRVAAVGIFCFIALATALGLYYGLQSNQNSPNSTSQNFYFKGEDPNSNSIFQISLANGNVNYEILTQTETSWILYKLIGNTQKYDYVMSSSRNNTWILLSSYENMDGNAFIPNSISSSLNNPTVDPNTGVSISSFPVSFTFPDGNTTTQYIQYSIQNQKITNIGGYSSNTIFSFDVSNFISFTHNVGMNEYNNNYVSFEEHIAKLSSTENNHNIKNYFRSQSLMSEKMELSAYNIGSPCGSLRTAQTMAMVFVYNTYHPGYFPDGGAPSASSLIVCTSSTGFAYTITCTNYAIALNNWGGYDTAYTCTGYNDEIWVVFSGTNSVSDVMNDLTITTSKFTPPGSAPPVNVHAGFLKTFQGYLNANFWNVIRGSHPIVFMGHSLGGAIASLSAYYWKSQYPTQVVKIVSQGEPAQFWNIPTYAPVSAIPHERRINHNYVWNCEAWYQTWPNQADPVAYSTSAIGYGFIGTLTTVYNTFNRYCDSSDYMLTSSTCSTNYWTVPGQNQCFSPTPIVAFYNINVHYNDKYLCGSSGTRQTC